jgi:hypothetical protein
MVVMNNAMKWIWKDDFLLYYCPSILYEGLKETMNVMGSAGIGAGI